MDISETLSSIAEVAVTLVGFAAVFRAFRGEHADPHSGPRTTLVIEAGLVLVGLCYLPTLLVSLGIDRELSYRWLSALAALYWARWLWVSYAIRKATHATPTLYLVATALHVVVFLVSIVNASGVFGLHEALYFLGAVVILALTSNAFLAQFRAEQIG